MPQSPYIDGNSTIQQRAIKFDPLNSNAHMPFVALEDETQPSNPSLATTPMAIIRGLWIAIGTQADAATPTGSLLARLRSLLVDTFGAVADVADPDGTVMARLRSVGNSFKSPTVFARWGTSTVDTVSTTPSRVTGLVIHNRSVGTRFLQFFNRTTNPPAATVPLWSIAIAPGERLILNARDLGGNDGLAFSTGLAWAMSTTEGTYTAATPSETSLILYWRSL